MMWALVLVGLAAAPHAMRGMGMTAMPRSEDAVVFVLGGPGAGKGTQCELLNAEYGLVHLSAGDLLRKEASKDTKLGGKISQILAEGQIVPSEVTVELLLNAMKEQEGPFIIDGFPRNLENLDAYEKQGGDCEFILFFELEEEEMCKRCLERGETSGRSDDNIETIKKRFRTFREQTMPVIDDLEKRGLVRRVSATASPDGVFKLVKPHFEELLCGRD